MMLKNPGGVYFGTQLTRHQEAVLLMVDSISDRYGSGMGEQFVGIVGQALGAAAQAGCKREAMLLLMQKRADWRRWLTVTQRRWQASGSRRPSRARHHDSIAIREKYVRCYL